MSGLLTLCEKAVFLLLVSSASSSPQLWARCNSEAAELARTWLAGLTEVYESWVHSSLPKMESSRDNLVFSGQNNEDLTHTSSVRPQTLKVISSGHFCQSH